MTACCLELVAEEDIDVERVGRALCEELEAVRDDLLGLIVATARTIDGDVRSSGELRGLIRALGLVLDVDATEADRQALRKIAADRAWRAA